MPELRSVAPPFHMTTEGRAEAAREATNELLCDAIAASLAGGIIAASGRPHSIEDAVTTWREVKAAMTTL